ncbi:MAG: hypothetical protein RSC44_02985, partial [Clostridia bacterium]
YGAMLMTLWSKPYGCTHKAKLLDYVCIFRKKVIIYVTRRKFNWELSMISGVLVKGNSDTKKFFTQKIKIF